MGTISKALDLLSLFSTTRPSLGLGEVVRLSGRDKATVHRHLVELAENGFLEQNSETRAYRLGPALLRLASVREASTPVRTVVAPIVVSLARDLGELVHFSLLHGTTLSPVSHHDPRQHGTQVQFDEAELLPLHATASGLAVLAFGQDGLQRTVLSEPLASHASNTITDHNQLRAALDTVRESGLAASEKGFDDEVASVAVPVFGPDGQVTGALAVGVPVVRMSEDKRTEIALALPKAASRVTTALGGAVPGYLENLWQTVGREPQMSEA